MAKDFPEHARRSGDRSPIDVYLPYLKRRWQDGCHIYKKLLHEIQAQGYVGSGYGLRRILAVWRREIEGEGGRINKPLPKYARISKASSLDNITIAPYGLKSVTNTQSQLSAPSPRRIASLLQKSSEELNEKDRLYLDHLFELSPDIERAQSLTKKFISLMRKRKSEEFDDWLVEAESCHIPEMKAFARGLTFDYDAVKAGLTLEWSNGQVEGQVNRLKMIKRSMYGRAKMDLLRSRVLYSP